MTKRNAKSLTKERHEDFVRRLPELVRYLRYGNQAENKGEARIWRSKSLIAKALCIPVTAVERVLDGKEIDVRNLS